MKPRQSLSLVAGANLKRLIKEAGLTQKEAAYKLGYGDDRQIRRLIKNGIRNIDEIKRIADTFDVSYTELLKPLD